MTLEEYMRELVLMERQYGQEEELYPLINMLLRENDNVRHLSVRDVHNAERKKNPKDNNHNNLFAYGSFPDMVILDENYHINGKKYGCVEIKILNDDKKMNAIAAVDAVYGNSSEDEISFDFYDVAYLGRGQGKNSDIIKIQHDINQPEYYNTRYDLKKIEESSNLEKIKEIMSLDNKQLGDYIAKDHTTVMLQRHIKINQIEYDESGFEGIKQLFGELLWYKKLLYTNGLEWYYLEMKNTEESENVIDENENWISNMNGKKVLCVKIGDLKDIYEKIKTSEAEKQIEREHLSKWNHLKYNLASINWFGSNVKEQFQ